MSAVLPVQAGCAMPVSISFMQWSDQTSYAAHALLSSQAMRVACFVLSLLVGTGTASAQAVELAVPATQTDSQSRSPAAAEQSADVALRAALEAYESGDLPRAEKLLSEVHARQPSARTLRGLGIVAYRQERYPEAVSLLEGSLVHPTRPLTPALDAAVRELLVDAKQRVGLLDLTVFPADARIVVDGVPPLFGAAGTLVLTPGAHQLELSAQGHESVRLGVSATAGVQQSMKLELRALTIVITPEASVEKGSDLTVQRRVDPAIASKSDQAKPARSRRLRRASYVMFALTGMALATAGAAALRAQSKIKDIEAYCRERPDGQCEPGVAPRKERAANIPALENLATVSLISAGSTAVAGGALTFAAWLHQEKPSRAAYLLNFTRRF